VDVNQGATHEETASQNGFMRGNPKIKDFDPRTAGVLLKLSLIRF
jgi:hypothetical protein